MASKKIFKFSIGAACLFALTKMCYDYAKGKPPEPVPLTGGAPAHVAAIKYVDQYPTIESKVMELIRSGDSSGADKLIEHYFGDGFRKQYLSVFDKRSYDYVIAQLWWLKGKNDFAAARYDSAVISHTNAIEQGCNLAYFDRSQCHLENCDFEESLADVEVLLKKKDHADDLDAICQRINANIALVRFDSLESDLEKIKNSERFNAFYFCSVGILSFHKGDYVNAIKNLTKGAENDVFSLMWQSLSYEKIGDMNRAADTCKRVIGFFEGIKTKSKYTEKCYLEMKACLKRIENK